MAPRMEVERHLSDAIDAAQRNSEARRVRRLTFVKNLYRGDSANEAGGRVGIPRTAILTPNVAIYHLNDSSNHNRKGRSRGLLTYVIDR